VLDEVTPGYARITLEIRPDHLNGHGIFQGGVIFTLADSAFACDSHNRIAVAHHDAFSYRSPGKAGETLIAEARENSLAGRSGVTDVTISGGDGRLVAHLLLALRQIGGRHFDKQRP